MAKKYIIDENQTATVAVSGNDSIWKLVKGVSIETQNQHGMYNANKARGVDYRIEGEIDALGFDGFSGILDTGRDTHIDILGYGDVYGHFGISVEGRNALVENRGKIAGAEAALKFAGDNFTFSNQSYVTGTFDSTRSIVVSQESTGGKIINGVDGLIDGMIEVKGTNETIVNLTNHGVIEKGAGSPHAIDLGHGDDRLVNRGTIEGSVWMNVGDDLIDLRKGTVDGKVWGALGDDTYIINDTGAYIDEYMEEGYDTIKTSAGFDGSANFGHFERIILNGRQAVDIVANGLDNVLVGNRAGNEISGGGGNDRIRGVGGADTFIFKTDSDRDMILDFGNGNDKIDVTGWVGVHNFNDIKDMMKVKGDNLVIRDGVDTLVLKDVDKGELGASDFIF